jgi:syntaxin 16
MGEGGESILELDDVGFMVENRNEEINNLVGAINDLAVLFKELSVLVIDQGTIIDRIDYNV